MNEHNHSGPLQGLGITLATRVTILRILGIPVFILFMIYYRQAVHAETDAHLYRWLALGTFLAVALTDALDGWLARTRNEVSRLGILLDPIADKGLMLAAVIMLTRNFPPGAIHGLPIWYGLLIISRDAVLIGGAILVHFHCGHVDVQPRWTGKLATVLVMLTIMLTLLKIPHAWQLWADAAGAAFVAISGIQYLADGILQLEKGHPGGHHDPA